MKNGIVGVFFVLVVALAMVACGDDEAVIGVSSSSASSGGVVSGSSLSASASASASASSINSPASSIQQ